MFEHTHPIARALALVALLALAPSACGKDDEPEPEEAAAPTTPAEPAAAPTPAPTTEAGLVEAVAAAIEARNMKRLLATAAPELAADLNRMHEADPDTFWLKGQQWVENVQSGFTSEYRTDQTKPSWRVLLHFGNGKQETVTFTRIDGRILFEQL